MLNIVRGDTEYKYVPVLRTDISRIENKFGIEIPSALKDFYLMHNGKNIYMTYISVDDKKYFEEDDLISVDAILPLISNDLYYNVEAIKDEERAEGWIPNNLIPFAITQGGDYFYWNADDGTVYVIFDDGANENDELSKYLICSSVDEMFKRMNESYEKHELKHRVKDI